MGTAGAILIIASVVTYATSGASGTEVLIFVVITAVSLGVVIRLALWCIKKTKKTGSIYLDADQEGYHASHYEQDLNGKRGVCHTLLHPGGFVVIEGKKYAAISVSGFFDKGDKIEVVEVEGETLKVRKL